MTKTLPICLGLTLLASTVDAQLPLDLTATNAAPRRQRVPYNTNAPIQSAVSVAPVPPVDAWITPAWDGKRLSLNLHLGTNYIGSNITVRGSAKDTRPYTDWPAYFIFTYRGGPTNFSGGNQVPETNQTSFWTAQIH